MRTFSEKLVIGLLLLASFIFVYSLITGDTFKASSSMPLPVSKNRLGLVEIKGVILESEHIVKRIHDFRDNSAIRGLVVRIDSPGGGVAASQEIYEALNRYREETGNPVVASMASVAASGGYYVACGTDTIVANPGTTTGSIGVIMELMDYSDLLDKIGIKINTIKSGKFKDAGAGSREMTQQEKDYFQEFIDSAYNQFVGVVSEARAMQKDDVLTLADGRVYTGLQAKENGLVDEMGTFEDAILLAAQMANIDGEPVLVRPTYRKRTLFDLLFGDMEEMAQNFLSLPVLRYQLVYSTM